MTPGIDSNPFREAVSSQEFFRYVFGGSVGRSIIMSDKPEPKKVDSLGRKRLNPEDYSQSGGWRRPRHIVWTCKVCSRAWNVSSRSSRYDSKCRQCGTRNSILLTTPKTYYKGRERVTRFQYYSTAEDAEFAARKRNQSWMRKRTKKGYGTDTFVKASDLKKHKNDRDIS